MNARLPPQLKLEFEKVYKPYLLLAKKRYVGQKYDEGRSPPVMDAKGIEMVRRDNFPLLPQTMRSGRGQVDAMRHERCTEYRSRSPDKA